MDLKITSSNFSKFYSMILAWIPLLGIYKSFLPGVSIGELVLLICSIIAIFLAKETDSYNSEKLLIVFAVYSIINTALALLAGGYEVFWLHRLIRMLLYIFCICFVSKRFFKTDLFFKSANYLCILLLSGIIFQYIAFYATGSYIRLYGNFLPVVTEEVLSIDFQEVFSYSAFRPSSFLTEPAHIAEFMMIPFIYNIYHIDNERKCKFIVPVIITGITILLAKSMWGYVIILISVLYWILDSNKRSHSASWYFMFPILVVGITLIIVNSSLFSDTFSRIDIFDLGHSMAFTGRFGGYDLLENLSIWNSFFGSGFGASVINRDITNGIVFLLYGSGYVGAALIGMMLMSAVINRHSYWQRTLTIVFFALMFGSNIFFSTNFILVCSCIFGRYKNNNDKMEVP